METTSRNVEFIRTEPFEIGEERFKQIRIDNRRIVAIGNETRFELLISFIGGSWMKRWRHFGDKILGLGLVVMFFGVSFSTIGLVGVPFFVGGILIILLGIFLKREAIVIYCPGQKFKIEGSSDFIEDVWDAIIGAHSRKEL